MTSGSHLPSSPSPFSGSLQLAGMEPSSRTPPPPPPALLLQWSQHHGRVKSSKSALHLNFSGFPRGLTPEALVPLPCPSSRIPFSPLFPPALLLPAHSTPAPFNSSTFTSKHLQGHTEPLDTEPSASSLILASLWPPKEWLPLHTPSPLGFSKTNQTCFSRQPRLVSSPGAL